eukprot:Lithocolla_globosa_v1_NODE_11475_length_505_cov_8.326667.p1 type:complete len:151 gc:universal NODE_11475_length_505_cov_8.326667:25-477(+)
MNSPLVIKNFRTKTLTANFVTADGNTIDTLINLEFIPDEIILKCISVYDADNVDILGEPGEGGAGTTPIVDKTKMYHLRTNLISDNSGVLASFPLCKSYHESYHIPFKNTQPINGTYNFTVIDAQGGGLPVGGNNFNMHISITLMFVKYK